MLLDSSAFPLLNLREEIDQAQSGLLRARQALANVITARAIEDSATFCDTLSNDLRLQALNEALNTAIKALNSIWPEPFARALAEEEARLRTVQMIQGGQDDAGMEPVSTVARGGAGHASNERRPADVHDDSAGAGCDERHGD